jgi:RNA 3'-terminal phosphate cyclase (ATP)
VARRSPVTPHQRGPVAWGIQEVEPRGVLVVDGSHGEGGGQIVRSAVSLSALLGTPLRVDQVRAGRSKPGLRPQHLTALRAAAKVCNAELQGDRLGSDCFTLRPTTPPSAGTYAFDVAEESGRGSAGSVGLILQTVLLPLSAAQGKSVVTIRGGTHVPWAPPATYVEYVLLPLLQRMGLHAQLELRRWGFYPAGGGEIQVRIEGRNGPLRGLSLNTRGELRQVRGTAAAMNLPAHIAQRMSSRATNLLAQEGIQATIEPRRLRGSGPGAGLFLIAEYEHSRAGFSALGRKGLPAEDVAQSACQDLLEHHVSGAPVGPHLADQLLLPMAVAKGRSTATTSCVSRHLLTNAWVVNRFLGPVVSVEGDEGQPGIIVVKGVACD